MKIKLENKIKNQLENLSNELDLKFNKRWFKFVWITKEQEILTEYLSNCRDPLYERYGHNINKRIRNAEKFYSSKDFLDSVDGWGGQVIPKKSIKDFLDFSQKINNKKLKDMLLDFCQKVEKKINSEKYVIALTKTKVKWEHKQLINSILRHEWLHVLFMKNRIDSSNWKYNEGLVTYFEFYLDKKLDLLEKFLNDEKYPFQKEYYKNAIIFRKKMKNKPSVKKIKEVMKLK